jgi:predicted DNA-binding protein
VAVRLLRLPLELDEAVADAVQYLDVPKSTWIRQAIEMALAVQVEEDQPISRGDALRTLTLLRPIHRAA